MLHIQASFEWKIEVRKNRGYIFTLVKFSTDDHLYNLHSNTFHE